MSVIAVISGKGGTGKTFCAINIACGLKMLKKSCLLVDCSFGIRNVDAALGRTTQSLCNIKDLLEQNAQIEDVIIKGEEEYMPDFICASVGNIPQSFTDKFNKVLPDVFSGYEYVIIDTPSSSGLEFDAVTSLSDTVIAVTTENYFSRQNTAFCFERVDSSKQKFLIINRCSLSKSTQGDFVAEDLADETEAKIIGIIREDEYADQSLYDAKPIVRYDTVSGREFERICNRIVGKYVPTDKKVKFFERNKLVLK